MISAARKRSSPCADHRDRQGEGASSGAVAYDRLHVPDGGRVLRARPEVRGYGLDGERRRLQLGEDEDRTQKPRRLARDRTAAVDRMGAAALPRGGRARRVATTLRPYRSARRRRRTTARRCGGRGRGAGRRGGIRRSRRPQGRRDASGGAGLYDCGRGSSARSDLLRDDRPSVTGGTTAQHRAPAVSREESLATHSRFPKWKGTNTRCTAFTATRRDEGEPRTAEVGSAE